MILVQTRILISVAPPIHLDSITNASNMLLAMPRRPYRIVHRLWTIGAKWPFGPEESAEVSWAFFNGGKTLQYCSAG